MYIVKSAILEAQKPLKCYVYSPTFLHRRSGVLRENMARAPHGLVLICRAAPAPPDTQPARCVSMPWGGQWRYVYSEIGDSTKITETLRI